MPPIQITDPVKDVAKINSAFQQLDALYTRLAAAEKQINYVQTTSTQHQQLAEITGINDLTFSWTGATGTISWAAGSVLNRQGNYVPIPAGSIAGLSASTTYWLAWNSVHAVMAHSTTLAGIQPNKNNLVICNVTTLGAGSNGAIGGGGTEDGGSGFNRTIYATTGGGGGTVTSIGIAVPTGFQLSGSPVTTNGTITIAMPSGWTTGDLLLGNGSNSVQRIAIGANTYVLTSNGTTATWAAASGGVSSLNSLTGALALTSTGSTVTIAPSGTNIDLSVLDMVGDSGAGGTHGLVPAPASGDAAAGKFLKASGAWAVPGGGGTVTSVALAAPAEFSVSGSPITTSGTITISKANQNANLVYAGPSTGAAAAPTFRSLVNADLPTSGVTAGSYTATNLTVNAQGIITAASNGSAGSGNGLWSQIRSATPTASSTGLSNYLGTGATSTNAAVGQVINGTSGGMGAYTTSVPSTPYTITVLLAPLSSNAGAVTGLGWTDGTKIQFIYGKGANSNQPIVQSNTSITAFSATNASGSNGAVNQFLTWLQISDDGTTVYFRYSIDGSTWLTLYSIAKASGFLGSSGYSHIFVGSPGGSGTQYVTVLSWTQS